MSFSLYIHIPYCQAKCPYCDFNSYAASSWPEADYTGALIAEMSNRADGAPWRGQRVKTLFFGGGTPSLFEPAAIASIIEAADRLFGIEPTAEITLEANPGTVSLGQLRGFRSAGVNRLSLGAQSFDDAILRFLGRIHTAGQTLAAVDMAHRAGFERLNLDLIFAVPGQSLKQVDHDLHQAMALGPDHISAYNLTFEEGTPFFSDMKRGRIRPLDSDQQASMYALVRNELPGGGYSMYEISNYSRRDRECRHNLSYWRAQNYLGLGAGAHSFAVKRDGGRRWWNERGPAKYMARIDRGGIAEAGSEMLAPQTAAGEFVFLNLRLREGFDLSEFEQRFGESFDRRFGPVAAPLVAGGLLMRDGGRIYLSERGLEIADSVFAEFV